MKVEEKLGIDGGEALALRDALAIFDEALIAKMIALESMSGDQLALESLRVDRLIDVQHRLHNLRTDIAIFDSERDLDIIVE